MTDFTKAIGAVFGAMLPQMGTPIANAAGLTAQCISTPIAASRELRDTGFWPTFHCIAELQRTDFLALALADRSIVTLGGKTLKVIGIEDDPTDPCVKLTLKEEPASA